MLRIFDVDSFAGTQTGMVATFFVNDDNSIEIVQVKRGGKSIKVSNQVLDLITKLIEKVQR